jgi:hypothetical protein
MLGGALLFSGRRQPSCDGMSRMMREYHVRFCERLGVKFPGPTRHKQTLWSAAWSVRFTSKTRHQRRHVCFPLKSRSRLLEAPYSAISGCLAFWGLRREDRAQWTRNTNCLKKNFSPGQTRSLSTESVACALRGCSFTEIHTETEQRLLYPPFDCSSRPISFRHSR